MSPARYAVLRVGPASHPLCPHVAHPKLRVLEGTVLPWAVVHVPRPRSPPSRRPQIRGCRGQGSQRRVPSPNSFGQAAAAKGLPAQLPSQPLAKRHPQSHAGGGASRRAESGAGRGVLLHPRLLIKENNDNVDKFISHSPDDQFSQYLSNTRSLGSLPTAPRKLDCSQATAAARFTEDNPTALPRLQ